MLESKTDTFLISATETIPRHNLVENKVLGITTSISSCSASLEKSLASKPRNSNMKSTRSLTIYRGEITCQQFPKSLDSERRGSGNFDG